MSTTMIWQTNTTDSADTERLGEQLGKLLRPPAVLELRSDLGGGKTTLTRGIVRGLGSKDTVSSSTFTLNNIYKAPKGLMIYHFDFYRLNEAGIIADQLSESLEDKTSVTIVEWGDVIKDLLPESRISIELMPTDNSEHRQIISNYPESLESIFKKLETNWQDIKP